MFCIRLYFGHSSFIFLPFVINLISVTMTSRRSLFFYKKQWYELGHFHLIFTVYVWYCYTTVQKPVVLGNLNSSTLFLCQWYWTWYSTCLMGFVSLVHSFSHCYFTWRRPLFSFLLNCFKVHLSDDFYT